MEEYFGEWLRVLDRVELLKVMNILDVEYSKKLITPCKSNVFRCFKETQLSDIKVVLIGQDPYPQKDVATGLLFANHKEVSEEHLSPSLQIIKESVLNFEVPHYCCTFDPEMKEWAKQGVLLLNSALTCEVNKPGSHTMIWRMFIAKLLSNLSSYNSSIVYVLFGNQAQTFKPYLKSSKDYIKEVPHPAYIARMQGTYRYRELIYQLSSTFIEVNKIIKGIYGEPIQLTYNY